MTSRPFIPNDTARRIFLEHHGLAAAPGGAGRGEDLCGLIRQMGFVQVDSINTVARAHDMILFSRRNAYRPHHLRTQVDRHRTLFEHWTHDASVIPAEYFPHWRLRFERDAEHLRARWSNWRRDGFAAKFDEVLKRISDHGAVCSAEVGTDEQRSGGGWWDWHPSKTALEYLWRTGEISVTRREGFRKYYDLTERVLPPDLVAARPGHAETIDWACRAALDRLGFATSGEIAAFWDLVTPQEARDWCAQAIKAGHVIEVDVGMADGQKPRRSFAWPTILDTNPPEITRRVRILSPFDPALRDRKRAKRLFGFDYRIEVFVPEPQRNYGYYVFPVLEETRLIGRIDMKCDRSAGQLNVRAFWPEQKVAMGAGRLARLETELSRIGRFTDCRNVGFDPDWLRSA